MKEFQHKVYEQNHKPEFFSIFSARINYEEYTLEEKDVNFEE
jgi:hypothetical protein